MALGTIKLLSSRRSYELPGDRLRLTMATVAEVIQAIKNAFGFQVAVVANPIPTFGAIPPTIPPGVVYNYGRHVEPPDTVVPIRYLHFEPQRIVIDVAGPSAAITPVYTGLREILAPVRMPDGSNVIGEPVAIREYSEITIQPGAALERLFNPSVLALFREQLAPGDGTQLRVFVPSVGAQLLAPDATFGLEDLGESVNLKLELRAGTRVDEQVLFSGAPLDSDAHIKYLESLTEMLGDTATA